MHGIFQLISLQILKYLNDINEACVNSLHSWGIISFVEVVIIMKHIVTLLQMLLAANHYSFEKSVFSFFIVAFSITSVHYNLNYRYV